uniref:Potassium channel domain-containing protein n=1 Tax=Panagrolaimus superbus TaxID=310955 RepID=A0A914Y091_9BILA
MTKYNISHQDYTVLEAIIVKAGIPLGLVMFQSIGERLNTFAAKVLRCCKKCVGRRPNVNHIDLILTCSGLSTFLIAAGAWVFHRYEGWTYFDSLYYCFTTLTTIGFGNYLKSNLLNLKILLSGDFVALQKDGALQNRPEYVTFSLIFIVLGLVLVGAAMNLLVLRFLTLNTEDEKRDKREAKLAERGLVPAESLGGRKYSEESDSSIQERLEDPKGIPLDPETLSVCSCSCYEIQQPELGMRHRHSVKSKNAIGSVRKSTKRRPHRGQLPNGNPSIEIEGKEVETSPKKLSKLERQTKIRDEPPSPIYLDFTPPPPLQHQAKIEETGQTTADALLRYRPSNV